MHGRHALRQEEINALLVERCRAGRVVTRLKGGDPFVFGRGGEEAEALVAAGLPFEVVPGVTSAIAAPAYAGIPVTHRALTSSVHIITGHEDPTKAESRLAWGRIAPGEETLVGTVRVVAPLNLAATIPHHASQLYAKNLANFVLNMTKSGELQTGSDDEIVQESLLTRGGEVAAARVPEALGMPPLPAAVPA